MTHVTDRFTIADFQLPIGECALCHRTDAQRTGLMVLTPKELQQRTRAFAMRVLRAFRSLPDSREGRILGQQLLRAATSVAANYRSACRARSRRDFLSKLGIVEEEADESLFWLEFIAEAGLIPQVKLKDLISEASQLTAIFVASRQTARNNNRKSEIANRKSS
ncbi:MAG: four helix bundle protein [Candidatus Sulfotelmatobacter sp.]